MFWDVLVYIVFVMGYAVSLIVFLLKRPDRRLASKRQRALLKLSYVLAGLLIAWFTIDLIMTLLG